MIDIHSHVLPGVDDGSLSIDESLKTIENAYENGVTDIVVTPHFIVGSKYDKDNIEKHNGLRELRDNLRKEKIKINLYLGNEVFVDNDLLGLLKDNKITTINNSRYLLFELPMHNNYTGVDSLIFELKNNGYEPIIAHPERYSFIKKDPSMIVKLIEAGALFQVNIGSFFGTYGKLAKKTAFLLVKHRAVHFIASDTHHAKDPFYGNIKKLKRKLRRYLTKDEIEDLFESNARRVLRDKKIKAPKVIPFKRSLLGKLK